MVLAFSGVIQIINSKMALIKFIIINIEDIPLSRMWYILFINEKR